MKFKEEKDRKQIGEFLNLTYNLTRDLVRRILLDKGFKIKEKGEGLSLIFEIYKDSCSLSADFYFHNLFLEIATKDRDAEALEFDDGLTGFGYFLSKATRLVESKIEPLVLIMSEENPGKGIEKIIKLAPRYERLRAIWRDKND